MSISRSASSFEMIGRINTLFVAFFMVVGLFLITAGATESLTITTGDISYNSSTCNYSYPNLTISGSATITNAKVYIADGYEGGDMVHNTTTLPSGISANELNPRVISIDGSGTAETYQSILRAIDIDCSSANQKRKTIIIELNSGAAYYSTVTGHYYEQVSGNTTWLQAKDAAAVKTLNGMNGYIAALTEKGILSGYPDNSIRPNAPITRAEVVKIMNHIMGRAPNKVSIDANIAKYQNAFKDILPAHWAYYEMLEATISHTEADFH